MTVYGHIIRILFVCHGNICRSPMAEYIFADLVKKEGLAEHFEIGSAATSSEETGNDIYPPAKRILRDNGIPFGIHRARRIEQRDFAYWDCIIGMDDENLYDLRRYSHGSPKISLLLDYTDHPGNVSDPWYTRDFRRTYDDITEGCRGLLEHLKTTM